MSSVPAIGSEWGKRFSGGYGRTHPQLNAEHEASWAGPFSFVQLADTQFGMTGAMKTWSATLARFLGFEVPRDGAPDLSGSAAYAKELEFAERAVDAINALQPAPAFVCVCGDLVNAFPNEGRVQGCQVNDFKRIFSRVREDVPLVCLCGNHDIGNRPTSTTIDLFNRRFGDDYFSFWAGGVKFLVLNSQLYKDPTGCAEGAAAQDAWLVDELAKTVAANHPTPKHVVALSHISPFIHSPEEPSSYFNLPKEVRARLLKSLTEAGCSKWFCGHYHRNTTGLYTHCTTLEVVTSSAVGATLTTKAEGEGVDPLGLSGMDSMMLSEQSSGMRLVRVEENDITHRFVTIAELPGLDGGAGKM